jgi:hypothetical protein
MLRSGDLNKLRRRPLADTWLLSKAFALLGLMRAAVVLFPLRWIVRLLGMTQVHNQDITNGASPEPEEAVTSCAVSLIEAQQVQASRIVWAVSAAGARTPWHSTCLVQALAGSVLLQNRKIPFRLNLGVAGDVESGITAHAWISWGQITPTGSPGMEFFHPISAFTPKDTQVH